MQMRPCLLLTHRSSRGMQARRYRQDAAALEQVFEYIMQSLANYRYACTGMSTVFSSACRDHSTPCSHVWAILLLQPSLCCRCCDCRHPYTGSTLQ